MSDHGRRRAEQPISFSAVRSIESGPARPRYWTQHRLARAKRTLARCNATLRADIARELREHVDDRVRLIAAQVADSDVRWLAGVLAGLSLGTAHHYLADLLDLERALLRIADGTYGTCVACGEPIDPMTLEFKPRTATCSRCSSLR